MPVHFRTPFAAAAAWGALQDCESDHDESPKECKKGDKENNKEEEEEEEAPDSIEKSLQSYCQQDSPHNQLLPPGRRSSYFSNDSDNNNNHIGSGGDNEEDIFSWRQQQQQQQRIAPSIQRSTSTFNDGPTGSGGGDAASLRMVNSFSGSGSGVGGTATATATAGGAAAAAGNNNNTIGPKFLQHQQQNSRVQLGRGGSLGNVAAAPTSNYGFVNGDFASGKVRDIGVDGCFVMAFQPSHTVLAVGARRSVDFYETTNYGMIHRWPTRDTQVSAMQWLSFEKNQGKTTLLGRSLLAVGDLAGNVSLLQVQDEVLEMYGPSLVHSFQVNAQIRAIDLAFVYEDDIHTSKIILLAVGDKMALSHFQRIPRMIYSRNKMYPTLMWRINYIMTES